MGTTPAPLDRDAVLDAPDAGHRAIRGGALRTGGYLAGVLLSGVASVLLLRHLGVVDFGRYATVMALVALATGLTEAGLTVVGQRLYAGCEGPAERFRLLQALVGIRLVLTPAGVLAAAGFAVIASYGGTLVLGTLVAGAGMVLVNTALTVALPLSMELRLGALTVIDFVKQLAVVGGIAGLALVGAPLLPFFSVHLAAGVLSLVVALALVRQGRTMWPRFVPHEWRAILRAAAPMALAVAVNQIYLRMLIILMSLLQPGRETGLFATASRVTEVLVGLPVFMVGAAFPILVHAAERDERRLAYALQRLAEVAFVVALFLVIGLVVAAEPLVRLLGGSQFAAAGSVLRVQALALVGASLTQVWTLGLVAAGRQSALVVTNLVALGSALVLGLALIPAFSAHGAAAAAALGEGVLAAANLTMLVRARPALMPGFGFAVRALPALGIAMLALLVPVGALVQGTVAAVVFLGASLLTGALPRDVVIAFTKRRLAV